MLAVSRVRRLVSSELLISPALHPRIAASTCRRANASCQPPWSPDDAERLLRRCDRLTKFLGRLRWPKQTHFIFQRQLHLPVRASNSFAGANQERVSQRQLEYMAGFFDGDGCASAVTGLGGVKLSIGQSADRAEVIMMFHRAFGGGIGFTTRGMGLAKPMIEWRVCGQAARSAAANLAAISSMKQPQLKIVADWPADASRRSEMALELKRLKGNPPEPNQIECTWAYLAGFFDAEGCISIDPRTAHRRLELSQIHAAPLLAIRNFLADKLPNLTNSVRLKGPAYYSFINGAASTEAVLTNMLAAGPVVKRKAAKIALALTPATHLRVRARIAQLAGNQCRHYRLDVDGMHRSKHILLVYSRLRNKGVPSDEAMALKQELATLRAEHIFCKAKTRYSMLRVDIRTLLNQGASHPGKLLLQTLWP
ncbi:unnamed protein product [Polarella glacialis]|uniref:Homing endonuclease LAGLIDADG domain-containing protein n=1 Tax=Polarella glacialis TaxID=89957 RepID=A0A813F6W9_POLGL|nr:unnamed protein product [Polarella glacialis]